MSKQVNTKTRNAYVSGSNALELEGNYAKYKKQRVHETKENNAKSHTSSRKVKTNMSYTIVLVFAIIATLVVTMMLLRTQFAVTEASEHVIDIQKELVQIKKSNELLATEINQSIDMNNVYEIATTELGMIQPTKDHIQYIATSESSYTVQYDAINVPVDQTDVTIGNVLGFIK